MISVLGVWEFFSRDVIGKSFWSIGLLGVVAIVVIIAGRFIGKPQKLQVPVGSMAAVDVPVAVDPVFTSVRHVTIVVLIVSVSLLALVGILSIWEVLAGDTVYKSLATMGIFAFASLVIVVTCLERENHKLLHGGGNKSGMSMGAIIGLSLVGLYLISRLFLL